MSRSSKSMRVGPRVGGGDPLATAAGAVVGAGLSAGGCPCLSFSSAAFRFAFVLVAVVLVGFALTALALAARLTFALLEVARFDEACEGVGKTANRNSSPKKNGIGRSIERQG